MIATRNLQNHIVLLGSKTGESLIEEYKKNHIFVLPSLAEGQPIVIPEAYTCGLPVIGTDVGDVKFLVDQDTGILCDPGDTNQLQAAIEAFIYMDEDQRNRLAENGYQKVLAEYTRESVSTAVYNEYKKLISK